MADLTLTPEQDAYLEELLDSLLGMTEEIMERADELEASPELSAEQKDARAEINAVARASLREKFLPEVAAMPPEEIAEQLQAVRNVVSKRAWFATEPQALVSGRERRVLGESTPQEA